VPLVVFGRARAESRQQRSLGTRGFFVRIALPNLTVHIPVARRCTPYE